MAGRGPRTGGGRRDHGDDRGHRDHSRHVGGRAEHEQRPHGAPRPADEVPGTSGAGTGRVEAALVLIRDLAGRPRGLGFLADHEGTLLTSHEAVDGLPRLVLHAAGNATCVVGADAVTPLPDLDLALVRTEGLDVEPLPLTVRERIDAGSYVRIVAGCWREARVLAATQVTYTATDRFHLLDDALELAIGTAGRDALRLGGGAAGGPVLDAGTGAVVGVLGTALHTAQRDVGFAVPLRPADGPLAALLARNALTVPGYGTDLNLAGILQLTATSMGQDGPPGVLAGRPAATEPVERADIARELAAFTDGDRSVLGLVGAPGSGRTTELAALAARRARGERPAPTLWLRGADLNDTDDSLADAARRTVERAARIVAASRGVRPEDLGDLTPGHLARLAARAGRPLLLLLDGPEEMPPVLAHRLPEWTHGTAAWLRETGARLVVACREEHWERAGSCFPADLLHTPPAPDPDPHRPSDPGEGAGARGASAWLSGVAGAVDMPDGSVGCACSSASAGAGGTVHGPTGCDCSRVPVGARGTVHCLVGCDCPQSPADPGGTVLDSAVRVPRPCDSGGLADRSHHTPAGDASAVHAPALDAPPGDAPVADGPVAGVSGGGVSAGRLAQPGSAGLPPCLRLGDFGVGEARRARVRYGIPDGVLLERDARHPLTLRLLAEVRAAVPDAPAAGPVGRHEVFAAYLDLMCLRIAVRLGAPAGLRGAALRRLAARVAGQVHEAARRSLGPGQGELDRESFEAVFPWGPAPARLGAVTGWASAVLTEGLLVPAGSGYRFAHEEFADWIQGMHLDLDEALLALVHRAGAPSESRPVPVPHHRVGPVVQALLLLAREHGHRQLSFRLRELADVLERDPDSWWGARLLARTLLQVPDATPYTEVLRLLADRVVAWRRARRPVPAEFGPAFWTALPVSDAERLDLLRRLVLADPAPPAAADRYLDAVAGLLADAPDVVQPLLTGWFADERPLPATPHATVATAAQALLHTHRHAALDDLTEVLVACGHRRADELLAVLAEEEPSAVCRAVDRWAHDERPARRVAAVAFGLRAAPYVRSDADRELLRYAALALLARPADCTLHGGALALLVRDPHTRDRYLTEALRHFAEADPQFPPGALVPALATHPEPVLEAFRARLRAPDAGGPDTGAALRSLADVTTPALARRVAALVREAVRLRPETAGHVAGYVDRRLEQGPTARSVLLPLVTGLLDGGPEQVRAALATVLAAAGTPASRPLRRELLEFLLAREQDPAVLDAVLYAAAGLGVGQEEEVRGLVHRTGMLLGRTPEGATHFDRGLVDLGRHVPGFAARMARWLTDTPDDWAAVVGPSARRMIENLAGVRVPA
ncbi:trypsin-like peptidase domain-containing protein [Streptomyces actinomycinicus]|uniref:Trypsin-like peptidase domain-containing protein n=1 Tax=Streptomyces actinomycinicus TaxID=1695166 RepID=A0A937EMS6_9ACTN|nr:trypsin-like peptidase domain-containing protein [Streptomyces actinomycinicus]MBL1084931.1 trypsin-like peptidase domain-containing protein [Streptomyces actinomycinicus]